MTIDQLERFLAKIAPRESGCWEWTACRFKNGSAKVASGSASGPTYAHRLAYEHFVGAIAADSEIDHLCRNRACVNPTHLEAVPHIVNVRRGACMGHVHSHDQRQGISDALKGQPKSPEARAKMSVAAIRRCQRSPRPHSTETKAKMAASRAAWWARKHAEQVA